MAHPTRVGGFPASFRWPGAPGGRRFAGLRLAKAGASSALPVDMGTWHAAENGHLCRRATGFKRRPCSRPRCRKVIYAPWSAGCCCLWAGTCCSWSHSSLHLGGSLSSFRVGRRNSVTADACVHCHPLEGKAPVPPGGCKVSSVCFRGCAEHGEREGRSRGAFADPATC